MKKHSKIGNRPGKPAFRTATSFRNNKSYKQNNKKRSFDKNK